MDADDFYSFLLKHDACSEARKFCKGKTLEEAWQKCTNPWWMTWLLAEIGTSRKEFTAFAVAQVQEIDLLRDDQEIITHVKAYLENPSRKGEDDIRGFLRNPSTLSSSEIRSVALMIVCIDETWASTNTGAVVYHAAITNPSGGTDCDRIRAAFKCPLIKEEK
jgi:hypothetical protein